MACAVLALYGKTLALYCKSLALYSKSLALYGKSLALYGKSRSIASLSLWHVSTTPLLVVILSGISVRTLCLTAPGIVFAGSFFYYIFFSGPACPCLFFCGTCLVIVFGGQFQTNHHRLCFLLVSCIEGAKVIILSEQSKLFCILFSIIDSLSPFGRPCIVISFSTNTIREPAPWQ